MSSLYCKSLPPPELRAVRGEAPTAYAVCASCLETISSSEMHKVTNYTATTAAGAQVSASLRHHMRCDPPSAAQIGLLLGKNLTPAPVAGVLG